MAAAVPVSEISIEDAVGSGGLALVGCGKMGGAMLSGWLAAGAPAARIFVAEPHPSDALRNQAASAGFRLASNVEDLRLDRAPSVLIVAVKPQTMDAALPAAAAAMDADTLLISVAAGTTIAAFEAAAPTGAPIIRAMPNTPAAVGKGAIGMVGNAAADAARLARAEALLCVVGEVARLDNEDQIDAVTALSGAGPAYVFHMIEALAAAGVAEGLPEDLAMRLARATIIGAGALAEGSPKPASQLRVDVTSPNGVTAAALEKLMDPSDGLPPLMRRAVAAGATRSRELRG